jgi:hypothetical protein
MTKTYKKIWKNGIAGFVILTAFVSEVEVMKFWNRGTTTVEPININEACKHYEECYPLYHKESNQYSSKFGEVDFRPSVSGLVGSMEIDYSPNNLISF